MKRIFSIIVGTLLVHFLLAQTLIPPLGHVFDDAQIPRIDILLPADSLDLLLALGNEYSNYEYHATFIFNNGSEVDTLENVGLRLRGNTSRTSPKKSFKISFNTYQAGRKYKGLEKMNLNGEHNDPSISRSKLGWDLLRQMDIPGSRSNHIRLYINDGYRGVYLNVEHIDEEFVQKRYGNQVGNLYKCLWPATLEYISNNPSDYKWESNNRRTYDLKTNKAADNYSDLAEFIDVLNNTPTDQLECELETVFNVNAYLKIIAFDIMTANWDGPIYNKNNFYLYHNPSTDLFEYIPYDLDNTMGIDWFNIDWATRNLYNWSKSGEPRPIYNRLMEVPVYRERFTYFVEKFIDQFLDPAPLFANLELQKESIEPFVVDDPFYPLSYGFDLNDFNNSFTQSLDYFHLPHGINSYLLARRTSALLQLENTDASPIVFSVQNNFPDINDSIHITATIEDDHLVALVELLYRINGGEWLTALLKDDGMQGDGGVFDGLFGVQLSGVAQSSQIEYYIRVYDSIGQTSLHPTCGNKIINIAPTTPHLVINEFMASNNTTLSDEHGEYDDWIEIYNADNQSISLNGKYLSDDPDQRNKWPLPNKSISPGQYYLFWADGTPSQGDFHTNFKLKASGEHIGIYESQTNSFASIDTLSYGPQVSDISQGRLPNGSGPIQNLTTPSPKSNNETTNALANNGAIVNQRIQPNPFSDFIDLQFQFKQSTIACIDIYNSLGHSVFQKCDSTPTNSIATRWNGQNEQGKLAEGLYFVRLSVDGKIVLVESIVLVK